MKLKVSKKIIERIAHNIKFLREKNRRLSDCVKPSGHNADYYYGYADGFECALNYLGFNIDNVGDLLISSQAVCSGKKIELSYKYREKADMFVKWQASLPSNSDNLISEDYKGDDED